ncbi:hypothetical protein GWK36_10140 [Caldichromatium japonicum]|uniref:Uncharacterized protein n=2 Tax=Caldichromatium japonicum TaxID=2699430 RepID=A0A6G7VGW9_9GAMM|nr:hypothetical protein GWK36_10140 [Caldichromatium japonicum]
MRAAIGEIRRRLPFHLPPAELCTGDCRGCSLKLLGFLDSELMGWEQRLDAGERPGLSELSQLLGTARKVERVLSHNGLLSATQTSCKDRGKGVSNS